MDDRFSKHLATTTMIWWISRVICIISQYYTLSDTSSSGTDRPKESDEGDALHALYLWGLLNSYVKNWKFKSRVIFKTLLFNKNLKVKNTHLTTQKYNF